MSKSNEPTPLVEPLPGTPLGVEQSVDGGVIAAKEIDPNNPPWGLLAGFLTWIASIILLIILQLLFVIPYTFSHFKGGDKGELARFLTTDKTAILLQILSLIPTHLLTFLIVWAVVTRFGKRPFWRSLGWSWGRKMGFWASVGAGIGLYVAAFLLTNLLGGVKTSFDQTLNSSRTTALAVAFLAFATAPIAEELVYRGVLYSALHKTIGVYGAVIGVLVLFTAVHVPQYWPDYSRIGVLALMSLSLTLVRAYTGRLLPCFIIHSVFNGIQSALLLAEPYLPKTITGEEPKAPALLLSHLFPTLF